jgi:dephospho-CoA kinase
MLRVGLTGGIGSGKTTISDLFSNLGVPIIDTDLISHQLLELGKPGYEKVVGHFSDKLLDKHRQIDRRRLRRIVFDDEVEKHWLETTLHPIIYQQTQQQIEYCRTTDYVIVVVPLLFEAEFQTLVDRILVIDCCPETQIRRLTARDQIDLKLALLMISQQWTNEARLEQADDVIYNGNNVDRDLDQQVAELHQKYLLLAA